MNTEHLIYTQEGFISPRWCNALNDVEISSIYQDRLELKPSCLVWILTELENWENLCIKYSELGHKVVILSHSPNISELRLALHAGAKGYLSSLSNSEVLKKASSSIKNGAIWIPGALIKDIFSQTDRKKQINTINLDMLTARELEIAKLVGEGLNNKLIAQKLNIKDRTVKSHLTKIFNKLDVKDRLQLSLKMRS